MKYPPYPSYKPSGVEWLGDVPEHWDVKRGRFVLQVNPPSPALRALEDSDEVSFVPMEAVGEWGGLKLDATCVIGETSSGYTAFEDGDVIVAKITPCFENGKGALATNLLNSAALGTTELQVLRASQWIDRRFVFYLSISHPFRKLGESEMYGAGGQKRVPTDFAKDFRTGLPFLEEQRAIAAFLDAETAKIDTLIEKKQALIEKLKEQRTALISRTVTRGLPPDAARAAGLDPHPRLKPSGIEWLGDVPDHWEVKPLKASLKQIQQGWSPQCENVPAETAEWGVLKVGCVNGWEFNPEENKKLPDGILPKTEYEIQKGDFLVSRANTRELLGGAALVETVRPGLLLCDKLYRLTLDDRLLSSLFLLFFFNSRAGRFQIERDATGSSPSMQNIGQDTIQSMTIPHPPIAEQEAAATFLRSEFLQVDAISARIGAAIERLREYRSGLITAAVTGKIDVRQRA